MKKFLINTGVFALLAVVLLICGEWVVGNIETSYSFKYQHVRERGEGISTVILGSSHTYYGLKPELLGDSVFNLANVSQTPEYDLLILKNFKPWLPNLKRVVVPVSYFTYRDPTMEDIDRGLAVQYNRGMHLSAHSGFSPYNLYLYDFKAYAGRLRSLFLDEEKNECDSLGFGLGFDSARTLPGWKQKAAARARSLTRQSPGRAQQVGSVLEDIADFCAGNHIECVFVTTPVWQGFREAMDSGQYDEMQRLTRLLARRKGLRYYDFFDSPVFADGDFHDSDHLNDIGAAKLSEMLRDSLRAVSLSSR